MKADLSQIDVENAGYWRHEDAVIGNIVENWIFYKDAVIVCVQKDRCWEVEWLKDG